MSVALARSQVSMEFLLLFAAYVSLLAAFFAVEKGVGDKALNATVLEAASTKLQATCFFLEYFSLDARNTEMLAGEFQEIGEVSAGGGELLLNTSKGVARFPCGVAARSQNRLVVEQGVEEPV